MNAAPETRHSKRILVTGGTGMIGAALVSRLVADGHQVSVLVRAQSSRLRLRDVEARLRLIVGDLQDAPSVREAVACVDPEVVYHLASTPFNPPTTPADTHLRVICMGTVHLLEAVRARGAARVVATGSAAEYGSGSRLREDRPLAPATILGAAKAAASLFLQCYARRYQIQTVELRLFMPYGPWEHPRRLVPQTILSALAKEDVRLTEGRQQRDLVYLDDVVDALIRAGTRPVAPGSVFNIGSGVGTPVREVVERVLHLMGNPVRPLFGAIPTRADEIMEMSADITAARTTLGWAPRTSLAEGLRRTIAWVTGHRELLEQLADPSAAVALSGGR